MLRTQNTTRLWLPPFAALGLALVAVMAVSPTSGGQATALVMQPAATPTPCTLEFQDVPSGSTFYDNVRCLACRGIVGGYPCGGPGEPCLPPDNKPYFRPGADITRGQIAKIVSESAGFSESPGAQIYEDVPPTHTFYTWVNRLSQRGYIGGYACGGPGEPCVPPLSRPYFRPGANATRGQISKIVASAAGFMEPVPVSEQSYQDVPPDNSFFFWIEQLSRRNIIGGYPCGQTPNEPCVPPDNRPYFRWAANVTRGQATKIVANTFFPGCATPVTFYAVSTFGKLVSFREFTPGTLLSSVTISGLDPAGETVLGIDFRPATAQLYALGSTNRLYTVNTATGVATLVGAGPFTPSLSGTEFGFDFNPVVDRIRVVSDNGQNLRLNPDTGAVAAVDTNLAYAPGDPNAGTTPAVEGAGYTNSFQGATMTALYDIDSGLNILVSQNPPNSGTLNTVGSLGVDIESLVGFDIAASNGKAYAAMSPFTSLTFLYTVDLTSGAATQIGSIGGGEPIRCLAVAP